MDEKQSYDPCNDPLTSNVGGLTQRLLDAQSHNAASVAAQHDDSAELKDSSYQHINLLNRAREQSTPIPNNILLILSVIVSLIYVFGQISQPLPELIQMDTGGGDEPQGDLLPNYSSNVRGTLAWPRDVLYTGLAILGAGFVLNQARNWYMRRQGAEDNLYNELPQYWKAELQQSRLTKQQKKQLEEDADLRTELMRLDGPGGGLCVEDLENMAFIEALLSALIEKKRDGAFAAIAKFTFFTNRNNAPVIVNQTTLGRARSANNNYNMSQGAMYGQATSNNIFGATGRSEMVGGTAQDWFAMLKNVLKGHSLKQGIIQSLMNRFSTKTFKAGLESILTFLVQQHENALLTVMSDSQKDKTGLVRFVEELAPSVPVIKQVLTADILVDIADKLFFQTIEPADRLGDLMEAFVDMSDLEGKHCAMQFLVRMSAQLDLQKRSDNQWEKYIALFDQFRLKGFLGSWFDIKDPKEKGALEDVFKRMANVFHVSNGMDDQWKNAKIKFWTILTVLPSNNEILKELNLPYPFTRSSGGVSLANDPDEVMLMCDALRDKGDGDRCLDATFNILTHTEDEAVRQTIVRAILKVEDSFNLEKDDFPLSEKMKRVKEISEVFKTVKADAERLVRNILAKEASIFGRIVFLAYTQALAEQGLLNEDIEVCLGMLESAYPGLGSEDKKNIANDFMCFPVDPYRRGGWDILKEYFSRNAAARAAGDFMSGFLFEEKEGYQYRCYALSRIALKYSTEFDRFKNEAGPSFLSPNGPDVSALYGVYSFISEDGLFSDNFKRNVIFDLQNKMRALLSSPDTACSGGAQYGEGFYKEVVLFSMDDDRLRKCCKIFSNSSDFVSVIIDAFLSGHLRRVSNRCVYSAISHELTKDSFSRYSPGHLRELFPVRSEWVEALKRYLFLYSNYVVSQLSQSSSTNNSSALFSRSSLSDIPGMKLHIKSFIEDYMNRTPDKHQDFYGVFNPHVFDVMFPSPPSTESKTLIQNMMCDPWWRHQVLKFLSLYRCQHGYVDLVRESLDIKCSAKNHGEIFQKGIYDPAVASFLLGTSPEFEGVTVVKPIGSSRSDSITSPLLGRVSRGSLSYSSLPDSSS